MSLCWLFLFVLFSDSDSVVAPESSAKVLQDLHKLAVDTINSDRSVLEAKPRFELDRSRGTYRRIPCVIDSSYIDRSFVYNAILEQLICVEAYRRTESGIPLDISERLREKMDKLSLTLIEGLSRAADDAHRADLSLSYEPQARQIFSQADHDLDSLAAGLKNVSVLALPANLYPVEISSDPGGGTVRLMKRLTYRECAELALCGTDRRSWPWMVVLQPRIPLVGRYQYNVDWQNGDHAEGEIDISSDQPITFRKSPVP